MSCNTIICTLVPRSGAAVVGTVPGQGDIAAAAGPGVPHTHIAAFVLPFWNTLLAFLLLRTDLADATE